MSDKWHRLLFRLRTREVEITFARCPQGAFKRGLELGAGNGFQSKLLKFYVNSLVATDLNASRLPSDDTEGITYEVCDAEKTDYHFPPRSFDFIWASNLFEHLPDPSRALQGIDVVLRPGGVVILIMPNSLWKMFSLLGFYPNSARIVFRILFTPRRWKDLFRRYVLGVESSETPKQGNNLKTGETGFAPSSLLWPRPHGAYANNLSEFRSYRRSAWIAIFKKSGFEPITVLSGPVSSGYGFGWESLRRTMEACGIGTEFIYVLRRAGESVPDTHFFPR